MRKLDPIISTMRPPCKFLSRAHWPFLSNLPTQRHYNHCASAAVSAGATDGNSKAALRGKIFLSHSRCIYENLAFEEYLFRRHPIEHYESNCATEVCLIWRNKPAVVIGKYQNPWQEADIRYCIDHNIAVARRNSGGGAVYHDEGNINISIITSQKRHSRKRNLRLLAEHLNKALTMDGDPPLVEPNCRDDLCFARNLDVNEDGKTSVECKISGTAAKISQGRAYHHFTLLVDADLSVMRRALHSPLAGKLEESHATRSVPAASVGYLRQRCPHLQVDQVVGLIGEAFASQFTEPTPVVEWAPPRPPSAFSLSLPEPQGEDPHEAEQAFHNAYPGYLEHLHQLRSAAWVYGRTPKFALSILYHSAHLDDEEENGWLRVRVEQGRVRESLHPAFPVGDSFFHAYLAAAEL